MDWVAGGLIMIEMMLSARQEDRGVDHSEIVRIIGPASSTTLQPPLGAKFMRVAVIGRGADGSDSGGGGGGGCAATKIVKASAITYQINHDLSNRTTATFPGYDLRGTGAIEANGGRGIGGDFNFFGGNSPGGGSGIRRRSGGGGAAGPAGKGGDGASTDSSSTGGMRGARGEFDPKTGWHIGGGAGGGVYLSNNNLAAVGGGGAGADAGSIGMTSASIGGQKGMISGGTSSDQATSASGGKIKDGGEMGGGGAMYRDSSVVYTSAGGPGGIIIEWFF